MAGRLRPRLTAKAAQYHLQNAAGHRRESSVKVQGRPRVAPRIFLRSVVVEGPNVSDSPRRRQQVKVHMSVVHLRDDHNLRSASQRLRRLLAHLRVKRAAREKEGRALMGNLVRPHQEVERLLLAAVQPEAEHPRREPSTAKSSHNTERNNQRKERHGQGRNNSAVTIIAAPERKIPEPFFWWDAALRGPV